MKNIKYLFNLICIALVFVACDDDYDRSSGGQIAGTAPVLHPLAQSEYTISYINEENEFINEFFFRLSWEKARFTYGSGLPAYIETVNYAIEVDLLGNEFENAVKLVETTNLYKDVTTEEINNTIKSINGGVVDKMQYLEFRIVAYPSSEITSPNEDGSTTLYSNTITLTVSYQDFATEPEPQPGPKVVKWKITEGQWDQMAVYVWGDSELFGGWPGKVVNADEYGWYSVTIPEGFNANLIINNNNGGSQLDLINPTENVQLNVNLSTGEITDATEWSITLRWKQVEGDWDGMAIYAWGGEPTGETFGGWPGKIVTANEEGWYSVTAAPGQTFGNAILNNNGGGSQFDINMEITTDVCLEVTGSSYTVVSCE